MGIKIPTYKEGGEWCGEDGFITHIDVVGVDRYAVHFQPALVEGRKLVFSPGVIHKEHCVTVEMDGSTLSRVLYGETISIDSQGASNPKYVFVVRSDEYVECVMSDHHEANRFCALMNLSYGYPYCEVKKVGIDAIKIPENPVVKAFYNHKDNTITYLYTDGHCEPFMQYKDVFVCTVDYSCIKDCMDDAVHKKFSEYKTSRKRA